MIGDGGFLHALERRGYVRAGPYTPECTVENPEAVRQLPREFLRAGADVMQACTFNGTQESIVSRGVRIKAQFGLDSQGSFVVDSSPLVFSKSKTAYKWFICLGGF